MKRNPSFALLSTAALLTLTATLYGQAPLKVNVPFAFTTTNASLAAGRYTILSMTQGSVRVVGIENLGDGASAMAIAATPVDRASGGARMVFKCGDLNRCALVEAYDGRGRGWTFYTPVLTGAERERLAVVSLPRSRGE